MDGTNVSASMFMGRSGFFKMPDLTFSYKTVFIGESGVGKSSIAQYLVHGRFNPLNDSTIGSAFLRYTHSIHGQDGINKIKYDIWDTAGQERFRNIVPMYLRNAQIVIMVYDAEQPETLDKVIEHWWPYATRNAVNNHNIPPMFVLVENKADRRRSEAVTSRASEFCLEHGIMFFRTSCKEGQGVFELFEQISRSIIGSGTESVELYKQKEIKLAEEVVVEPTRCAGRCAK
jgi:Ras-related protein Rab-5C